MLTACLLCASTWGCKDEWDPSPHAHGSHAWGNTHKQVITNTTRWAAEQRPGHALCSVHGGEPGGRRGVCGDGVWEMKTSRNRGQCLALIPWEINWEGHMDMCLGILLFSSAAGTPRGEWALRTAYPFSATQPMKRETVPESGIGMLLGHPEAKVDLIGVEWRVIHLGSYDEERRAWVDAGTGRLWGQNAALVSLLLPPPSSIPSLIYAPLCSLASISGAQVALDTVEKEKQPSHQLQLGQSWIGPAQVTWLHLNQSLCLAQKWAALISGIVSGVPPWTNYCSWGMVL